MKGLYFNYDYWGLRGNGLWVSKTFVNLNDGSHTMTFAFSEGPGFGIGGFMNYTAGFHSTVDLVTTAFDAGINLLESYNTTDLADIVTPDGRKCGGSLRHSVSKC